MALSWQSLSVPNLKNMMTVTGGGSFAGLVSSGISKLQSMSLYGERLDWENDDDFEIASNQLVTISAGVKGSVTGYLSEPLTLSGGAKWEPITNNTFTGLAFKLVNTFDENQQLGIGVDMGGGGTSYNQPWASRKFWKGSDPFALTLKFNFITINNAKDDVYTPAIKLLSFCYPRLLSEDTTKTVEGLISGLKIGNKQIFNVGGTNTEGGDNVVTAFANAFKSWAIPGPSIYYDSSKNDGKQGDNVNVVLGNLFAFGQCYVTNVNLEFAPTLDSDGFPLWCKCSLSFETAESNYCNTDGTFTMTMGDNASTLGNLMSSIGTTVKVLIQDLGEHLNNLMTAVIH